MKKLLSALFLLALCSSLAMATVPDPSKCSVTPDYNGGCLIAPGVIGGTTLSITVRNSSNNPINNAVVTVSLNAGRGVGRRERDRDQELRSGEEPGQFPPHGLHSERGGDGGGLAVLRR
jgi:hypothetical protein